MTNSQALLIAGSIILSAGIVALALQSERSGVAGAVGALIGLYLMARSGDLRKREQKEPPAGHQG